MDFGSAVTGPRDAHALGLLGLQGHRRLGQRKQLLDSPKPGPKPRPMLGLEAWAAQLPFIAQDGFAAKGRGDGQSAEELGTKHLAGPKAVAARPLRRKGDNAQKVVAPAYRR